VTAVAEQHATAVELLRRLASHPDRLPCDDGELAGLKEALAVAAQACEQVDQARQERACAEREREEALLQAAQMWSLLEQAAEVVDAHIARDDGGSWETLTLAFELRQAVETEPDELGARLLGELHAARVALRAALGLAGAVRRGEGEAVDQCLGTFQQASRLAGGSPHAPGGPRDRWYCGGSAAMSTTATPGVTGERTLLEAALARLDAAALAVMGSAATTEEQHEILGCLVAAHSLLHALCRLDPAAVEELLARAVRLAGRVSQPKPGTAGHTTVGAPAGRLVEVGSAPPAIVAGVA
jgi:hypothetical protein